jgi:hypothetical protein
MAQKYVQVEVLLMTGTTFSAGNWVKKDDEATGRQPSEIERLQEACWNGLLKTMLPELWIASPNGGNLYLWEVKEGEAFLALELSEVPLPIDPRWSLTPHSFLSCQDYN